MFKNIFTFSIFTLFSRIFGLIRDMMIAFTLGTQFLSDVFFVAFRIPNLFRVFFAEGSVSISFINVASSFAVEDKDKMRQFSSNIFSILFFVMTIFCIFLWFFFPYIVKYLAPGFYADVYQLNLIMEIGIIMLPYLLFISLSSLLNAISQMNENFKPTAFSPIILNICLIYTLVFFSSNILYNLAISVWIAGALQFILALFITSSLYVKITLKFNPKFDNDVKLFFKRVIPAMLSNCMLQLNIWVDTVFASFIPGAVSCLYYADRINQLPQALIGTAISTVLLPLISKKIRNDDNIEAIKLQNDALELGLMFAIPAVAGIAMIADYIITSLFNYGNFSFLAVEKTAKILTILAFSLPSVVINKVLLSGFYARGNFRITNIFSIVSLLINISLNLILIKKYGYISLAIATTCSCWVNTILLMIYVRRIYAYKMPDTLLQNLTKIFFATIIMTLILAICTSFTEKYLFYGVIYRIVVTIFLIALGIVAYFLALKFILRKKNLIAL